MVNAGKLEYSFTYKLSMFSVSSTGIFLVSGCKQIDLLGLVSSTISFFYSKEVDPDLTP